MNEGVTLGSIQKLPFFTATNFSQFALKASVDWVKKRKPALGEAIPEHEALDFYLLNHAWAELRMLYHPEQPLSAEHAEIALQYAHRGAQIAERLYGYLLLICTRESRHCKNISSSKLNILGKFGSAMYSFLGDINGTGSGTAVTKLETYAPDVLLGHYTSFLEHVFFKGTYSGGYGGKAWGEVAKALNRFVQGQISAEMLVDTGWTLAHNNGPIFNKGMLYQYYSDDLKVLLDVQRGGQVPQLVHEFSKGTHYITRVDQKHVALSQKIAQLGLSPAWASEVDWEQIEALGSVKSYQHFKKTKKAEAKAKAVEAQHFFYVTPTVTVKKLTRAEMMLAS